MTKYSIVDAYNLLQRGDIDEALAAVAPLVEDNPAYARTPYAWALYGDVLEAQGKIREAWTAYERAHALLVRDVRSATAKGVAEFLATLDGRASITSLLMKGIPCRLRSLRWQLQELIPTLTTSEQEELTGCFAVERQKTAS